MPCPCGKSSDAYSIDVNGAGFCFSGGCGRFFPAEEEETKIEAPVEDVPGTFKYYSHRGISENAMRFYDVKTKFVNEQPLEVGFTFPNKAIQVRSLGEKKFRTVGQMNEAGLWGTDKFDRGSKSSITITEGCYDALAVYDMTNGNTAAVAIKSSTSGRKECIRDWEYINSFDKIILCLDNDDPGQTATREIAALFDFNKVYQVKLTKYKDANKYLEEQDTADFFQTFKRARRFAPDNIISTFSEIEKTLEQSKEDQIGTYPFTQLNAALYGLHQGEVIVFKGPEGIGKTEIFRATEHHLLKTTKHPIGIIHLEEDNGTTVKAIAGYELEVPAVLPDCGLSNEEIFSGYKKAVRDDEGRVHLYSSFDVEDEDAFLANIRFLVAAAGCKFIFLDHISWLATGMETEDERKKLDRISQKLKLLAKELKFCLIMISHVNDEGKTRGSRNITKVANTVIDLSRNLTTADISDRNMIWMTIEKARLGGQTGPAGRAFMNRETGRLEDVELVLQ